VAVVVAGMFVLAAAGAVATTSTGVLRGAPRGLLAQVDAIRMPRAFLPRLSVDIAYRGCTEQRRSGETLARHVCGDDPLPAEALALLENGRQGGEDPSDAHAAALLDMQSATGTEALDRAVRTLQARAGAAAPAGLLADLAAAYLLRAERTQAPRDLLLALEAAERAVAADAKHPAALFNRALAVEGLHLNGEADAAWRAYLAADGGTPWAREARTRLAALAAPAPLRLPPSASAGAARQMVAADRQRAAEAGWDVALGGWGEAVLRGDRPGAAAWLASAAAVGAELVRVGGEPNLADAVQAIHAHPDGPGLRALARAHRDFAAGRRLYLHAEYPKAAPFFDSAAAGASASPALADYAAAYVAMGHVYARDPSAEAVARLAVRRLAASPHLSAAGRAYWVLGTYLRRARRQADATGAFQRAEALFTRAGERENLGSVLMLQAEIEADRGETVRGYADLQRALELLGPYRTSGRMHVLLELAVDLAARQGLVYAARRLQAENLRVVSATGAALWEVEVGLTHARMQVAAGDRAGALAEADRIEPLIARLDTDAQAWFRSNVEITRSLARGASTPDAVAGELGRAVRYFRGNANWELRGRLALADTRVDQRALDDAVAQFDTVLQVLHADHSRVNGVEEGELAAEAPRVRDRLVSSLLAANRAADALAVLDRSRSVLRTVAVEDPRAARGVPRVPAGRSVLVYAHLGDTLFAWTVRGSSVVAHRLPSTAAAVDRDAAQALASLEGSADEGAALPALSRLYDGLVRPVAAELGPPSTDVVVIADGPLAALPFAALFDRSTGHYLVQDHGVRTALGVRQAAAQRRARNGASGTVLVASPDPAGVEGLRLDPLPGARAEADSVQRIHPGATRLSGGAASREALLAALPRAGLFHFAGHAIANPRHPESSYLAVAPGLRGGAPTLDAATIGALDLRRLQLVVLSACQTQEGAPGGGAQGLAGAFLGAGAGGVVASLWRVGDLRTRELTVAFHHAYRTGATAGDASAALRAVQLRFIDHPDRRLRSPAVWAAFQYAGT
jgi:CHAT domain-containing protein